MKKSLLLIGIVLTQFTFGQTPVYHHSFNGSLESPGFTIGAAGNYLSTDLNGVEQNALTAAGNHQLISLNILDYKEELMQEGTISLWYKHTGTGESAFGTNKPLVYWSNGNSSYSEGLMYAMESTGKIRVLAYQNSEIGVNTLSPYSFPLPGTGQWNQYTVSYKFGENGYIKGYLNGTLVVEGSISFDLPENTTNNIVFTGFNSTHSSSLVGSLDEIRVFTESLTDDQIRDLFLNDLVDFTMPEPIIVHEFSNEFYKENFNLGEKTYLAKSRHNTFANALRAPVTHTGIAVDLDGHKNELAQAGTISFWYNHAGMTQTTPGYKPLFNLQDANENGHFRLSCGFNNATNNYMVYASSPGSNNNSSSTELSTFTFPTNQWHQYTLVYQTGVSGYADFYLDGQKIHRFNGALSPFNFSPQDLGKIHFLGKDPSYYNYIYGLVDGIRIYDQALTPMQVAELFNIVDNESPYYPFVYYNLDNNIYDSFRVFNAIQANNTTFGEDINGVSEAAGYLNTQSIGTVRIEIDKEFNQYITGDMTTGFGFKVLDIPGFSNYSNVTIPLFGSYNSDSNRKVTLTIKRSDMKLQLGLEEGVQELDYTVDYDKWYYAHIVIQENTADVYMNGELIYSYTSEEAFKNLSNNISLSFGKTNDFSYFNSNTSFIVGAMDEIFVEAKAYTFDEIQDSVQAYDPEGVLSVVDYHRHEVASIYPNPTQGQLNFSDRVDVQVYDVQGRMILQNSSLQSLDLSGQKPGVYIIKISNTKGSKTVKVIRK